MILAAGLLGWYGVGRREAKEASRKELQTESQACHEKVTDLERVLLVGRKAAISTLESELQAFSAWLGLTSNERVSLYELDSMGWVRRARFSKNVDFMRSGRLTLPLGQGIVHQSHKVGEFAAKILPIFESDSDGYFREQKDLNVPKGVCTRMTMRSQSYAGFAFGNDEDRDRPYVLLFESIDTNGLDSDFLESFLHDEWRQSLQNLLHTAASLNRS